MSGFDDLLPRIRPEIETLAARGNVTLQETKELRCNSYEWELLIPKMNDEAFIEQMQHALNNCSVGQRPFSTYDKAVCGLYGPELLKRFEAASRTANDYAATIDAVREALGQKGTHWLVLAGDVQELVDAVDFGEDAKEALRKIRENPGGFGTCRACSIEAEIGTEENPHPVPVRFHVCGGVKS